MKTRLAEVADIPALTVLIEASIRSLGAQRYDSRQIESSLVHLFGVDSRIIEDGTYFVVEEHGQLLGCGGWSRRKTPFGGDQAEAQDADFRDPAVDPAVIRAFFVDPEQTRRGIGRHLLEVCEAAALDAGFGTFELVATLTGVPLYAALGYRETEAFEIDLPDGVSLDVVRMVKP